MPQSRIFKVGERVHHGRCRERAVCRGVESRAVKRRPRSEAEIREDLRQQLESMVHKFDNLLVKDSLENFRAEYYAVTQESINAGVEWSGGNV